MDPLRGRLQVVDWDCTPNYGALSYTWADGKGDASLSRRIFLDDTPDESAKVLPKALPITFNCGRALRCLRKRETEVVIWVDAICIDQSSLTERSHQVAFMKQIYSRAKTVHVYVGEEECGDDLTGAQAMEALAAQGTVKIISSAEDTVLDRFLSRPYFSRLWVVQEVLLARSLTLHCGTLSADLSKERIASLEGKGQAFSLVDESHRPQLRETSA